jgi:hypothetical protein
LNKEERLLVVGLPEEEFDPQVVRASGGQDGAGEALAHSTVLDQLFGCTLSTNVPAVVPGESAALP